MIQCLGYIYLGNISMECGGDNKNHNLIPWYYNIYHDININDNPKHKKKEVKSEYHQEFFNCSATCKII